jgi:16S rRNA (adenine1518-N6/adenine1519-N6)-dimethyltransferase
MHALLKAHGLTPKKTWGQNFLDNDHALERIQAACRLEPGETVVEIGAGLGALTDRLWGEGRRVIAIERDRDLVPVLKERFADTPGIEIVEDNAVTWAFANAVSREGEKIKVIGNLPYQLSAPILFKLIEEREVLKSAHVLLQTEVAQRLTAEPNSKDYSLLTVLLQRVASVWKDTDIKPTCFIPPPKVGSRFVSMTFDRDTRDHPPDAFMIALIKAAFHQRRKTLANSLSRQPFLKFDAATLDALKTRHPVELASRPEQLPVSVYVELACELVEMGMGGTEAGNSSGE